MNFFAILPVLFFTTLGVVLAVVYFCIFFDQAVLTRRGTVYRVKNPDKKIAITFDDGPSPIWTPLILDELKKAGIKATFFTIGKHVKKYPAIAKRVAAEGHIIGNHGFAHNVILYYTPEELEEEIKYTELIIKQITGQTTRYFRPPKAWSTPTMKRAIKALGYEVVLWSLNSKDWVSFNHRSMVRFITRRIRHGDIILFHDSGSVLAPEGGDRSQTVAVIAPLVKELQERGFQFVTIDELLEN